MALPAGVFVTLGELALSPKVQDFTANLAKNVYGRIMPSKANEVEALESPKTPSTITLDGLAKEIEELPKREELVTAFAVLQAELDRQNYITRKYLLAGLALQTVLVVGVIVFLMR